MSLKIQLLSVWFLCFLAYSQKKQEAIISVGPQVQYELIGTYQPSQIDQITTSQLKEFLAGSPMPYESFEGKFQKAIYSVKLYRVTYQSIIPEYGNKKTKASGLVAIPVTTEKKLPMVSYQHGTVFDKTWVPSHPENSMETLLMIAQFASQGYILIGADYFGLGVSDLPNAYLVKNSTEQACVDMYEASLAVIENLGLQHQQLFLHGWSQGGWSNMTFLRKLEQLGIPVTAAATASAPVDASAIMGRWIANYQPIDAVYLPGCLSNYLFAAEYYDHLQGLTKRAIRPEFYDIAKDFYEFKIDWPTFISKTPSRIQDYVTEEFIQSSYFANDAYWQNLTKMEVYKWKCSTPLINYYGGKDEVVPVEIATLPELFQTLNGTKTTKSVYAGANADHRATYVYSVIHVKEFFDQFLSKK